MGVYVRIVFILLGFLFTLLGAIGVIFPILPTTPFLLLASFFFARGSEKFHRWFTETRLYQKHLKDFVTDRAMTLDTKVKLLSFASSMLLISFFAVDFIYARIIIILLIIYKYYYFIFKIRTIKNKE